MKTKRIFILAAGLTLICATLAFTPKPAGPEENGNLEKRIQKLEARIEELEKELDTRTIQTGNVQSVKWDDPVPGSVEARLQRLEKEVFNPDVKMVPCESK